LRGLYFLTTNNEVKHLDIIDKIKSRNVLLEAEREEEKKRLPIVIDEENLPSSNLMRREISKDDSFLLHKSAKNDNELLLIE
jgi:hypothetical protein